MGEYARLEILRTEGIDIGCDDEERRVWKWSCRFCGKRLTSEQANKQHTEAVHAKRLAVQDATPMKGTTP